MKKGLKVLLAAILVTAMVSPALAADEWVAKFSEALSKGAVEGDWQIKADDLDAWIKAKKTDFLVVDVRTFNPGPGQQGGKIPGSIWIPYTEILKAENLKKLPKDKKLILVCVTGQSQNLPILPLRVLGYDARTMKFGMASWIPGYFGGQFMQGAIQNAAAKGYPVEK